MILIIVVIFWHLPSRSRAGKSRLYLNHRRRSQEELIPCDTQCFYSHLSPPSWNFATNRFELWNRRSRIFWMQQLRPETKNFSGVVTPKKSAIHCNLSLFAINDKMLCNIMLPYFYLNSHIVWLISSFAILFDWLSLSRNPPHHPPAASLFVIESTADILWEKGVKRTLKWELPPNNHRIWLTSTYRSFSSSLVYIAIGQ